MQKIGEDTLFGQPPPPVNSASPPSPDDASPAGPLPSHGPETADDETLRTGTVVSSTGSWYEVQTIEGLVSSKARGKLRLREEDVTNPIAVGDRVTLRLAEDGTGYITEIHERQNALTRRAAGRRAGRRHIIVANVDAAWAVQAVRKPRLNAGFLDRFLVMAGVCEIPAGIIFNKTDLTRPEDEARVASLRALYEGELGYPVLLTSATEGNGLDEVREALEGRLSVLSGPSGAGKSTLLNTIEPGLDLRIGAVSEKTNKGRHTTTHAALYPLSGGGFVADTPGIREFGILDLEPDELGHFFVEFFDYLDDCRFPDCTHDHEPGCAVKQAVDAGAIDPRRYQSYLSILDALREGEANVGR